MLGYGPAQLLAKPGRPIRRDPYGTGESGGKTSTHRAVRGTVSGRTRGAFVAAGRARFLPHLQFLGQAALGHHIAGTAARLQLSEQEELPREGKRLLFDHGQL